jgi:hypothetical protein
MMPIRSLSIALNFVVLSCFVLLVGAAQKDFWASKPSSEWTDKQIDKLLKDSPWAKEITLSVDSSDRPLSGSGGGSRNAGGGGTGASSGGAGGAGQVPESIPAITVRWYARPIREALAARFSRLSNPPQEAIDKLMKFNSPFYSILIEDFPGAAGGRGRSGAALEQLKQNAYLQKKNKEKIHPADVVLPSQPGQALVLRFPREMNGKEVFSLEDKDVELMLTIRDNTYHIKFKFPDMVVKDKLEL